MLRNENCIGVQMCLITMLVTMKMMISTMMIVVIDVRKIYGGDLVALVDMMLIDNDKSGDVDSTLAEAGVALFVTTLLLLSK